MIPVKMTAELLDALSASGGKPVPIEDERTREIYYLVDQRTHRQAMEALHRQEDIAAIQAGIDDMEAGRVISLEEADVEIRKDLGFPPRVP